MFFVINSADLFLSPFLRDPGIGNLDVFFHILEYFLDLTGSFCSFLICWSWTCKSISLLTLQLIAQAFKDTPFISWRRICCPWLSLANMCMSVTSLFLIHPPQAASLSLNTSLMLIFFFFKKNNMPCFVSTVLVLLHAFSSAKSFCWGFGSIS